MEKKEGCERYEWNMKYRKQVHILSVLILTLLIGVNVPQV